MLMLPGSKCGRCSVYCRKRTGKICSMRTFPAIGRLIYYRRFSELRIPLLNFRFFAGGSFELATLQSNLQQVDDQSLIKAGSVFVGADTPLVPACLAFGGNDDDEIAVYFLLGRLAAARR